MAIDRPSRIDRSETLRQRTFSSFLCRHDSKVIGSIKRDGKICAFFIEPASIEILLTCSKSVFAQNVTELGSWLIRIPDRHGGGWGDVQAASEASVGHLRDRPVAGQLCWVAKKGVSRIEYLWLMFAVLIKVCIKMAAWLTGRSPFANI